MAEEEGRNEVSQLIGLENERTARRAKKQDTPNVAGSTLVIDCLFMLMFLYSLLYGHMDTSPPPTHISAGPACVSSLPTYRC